MDDKDLTYLSPLPEHLRKKLEKAFGENLRFLIEDTHTIDLKQEYEYCTDCVTRSLLGVEAFTLRRREKKLDKKYFGESIRFLEEEREEAKSYLNSWKKFVIRNLMRDSFDVEIVDEQWGEHPAYVDGALNQMNRMSLKLCVEANWKYELK